MNAITNTIRQIGLMYHDAYQLMAPRSRYILLAITLIGCVIVAYVAWWGGIYYVLRQLIFALLLLAVMLLSIGYGIQQGRYSQTNSPAKH